MAAGSIFVFVFAWNEYPFAMIFTTNRAKTAPLILSELMGRRWTAPNGASFLPA
ncbi:hypothetical protein MIC97_22790 [Aquamicrobium sp. NLF2-7]|uniref:hypothetical protein n=1 Tax=Aquamicrobium sp. NLF2-7 TaxID=2918753 RepID=UPI001EFA720D|nr:hypothetical protein [Aquamicrobium sp. NLF2-7]MCG8274314.1 hypothetical protein [Aquamicrobium sp. NLF2-7]